MKAMLCRLLLLLLAAASALPLAAGAAGFTEAQQAEIVGIVRDALKRDPSILRDAVGALQAADEQAQKHAAQSAIASSRAELSGDPAAPAIGNPQGAVTVVEFFDIRCPYCRQIEPTLAELIGKDRDVRLVFKDLPILGPASLLGARALLAAHRQGGNEGGAYVKLRTALMRPGPEPSRESIRADAAAAGLDVPRLLREMDDPAIQVQIDANLKLAARLGINGTPALVVGDTLIPGAVSLRDLSQAVEQARRAKG